MKNLIFLFSSLFVLYSCQPHTQTAENSNSAPSTSSKDSAAAAEIIHGFYTWYDAFSRNENTRLNFINDQGKHLVLDSARFEAYYAHFTRSGFVSKAFVKQEYAFFQKCEQLWQNEPIDEVPSCLDADKYFCAQDWELSFWTQSPVQINVAGENQLTATLYASDANGPMERSFELVKENGKWLIEKIVCDMGVE